MLLRSRLTQAALAFLVLFQLSDMAEAGRKNRDHRNDYPVRSRNIPTGTEEAMRNDQDLVTAVEAQARRDYVEGGNMEVIEILPDDNSGLRHQSWIVRLSTGQELKAVYNVSMCEYVPVRVGDRVAMGGQFIWTKQGPLLHWLHHDPRDQRPDGYVWLNGKFYCKE